VYSGKENSVKKVVLPLAGLSFSQKLDLMETLWADLARDEKKLESPCLAWPRSQRAGDCLCCWEGHRVRLGTGQEHIKKKGLMKITVSAVS
jgi:hypothetical protein